MEEKMIKQIKVLLESNLSIKRISELLNINEEEIKQYAYKNSYKTKPQMKNENRDLKILFLLYNRPDLTCYSIAKLLHVNPAIVYDINTEYGIRDIEITKKNYKDGDVEKKVISYLKETNLNNSQIARIFNVSNTYVTLINKKYKCR